MVAAGGYAQRVETGSAGEEIDLLAASLNSMAAQLQESEEARKRLLADLAHELRTPIASLAVTVEAVTDGVLEPDRPTLATLTEQTDRLTRLAGDLRDISDAEGGLAVHPLPCDVAGLLEKARAAAAEAYAAKGVRLEVEGTPAGTVRADAQRVGQVLANLLSNALRHTPSGGLVSLAATVGPDGGVLTVADTGDGIEAEHLPYVFERFYRTDTARARDAGGTGIGLATAGRFRPTVRDEWHLPSDQWAVEPIAGAARRTGAVTPPDDVCPAPPSRASQPGSGVAPGHWPRPLPGRAEASVSGAPNPPRAPFMSAPGVCTRQVGVLNMVLALSG